MQPEELREEYTLAGSPASGLWWATTAFFVGLTTIVFYGVAGPTLKDALGLSGSHLGLLMSSPHLSKAFLRVPFGAWVDEVGGKLPFLVLLGTTVVGMAGVVVLLFVYYPGQFDERLYWPLAAFGFLAGAGGATFSVGIPQTSYWFPESRQGFALGVYAGAGNIGPGLINYLVPLAIGLWGVTAAYSAWMALVLGVTLAYGYFAVDSYYFQLQDRELDDGEAREVAEALGQEVFPSGNTWRSLGESAKHWRTWVLVALYVVSFGGGFTALTAWFPTYWYEFHEMGLATAGLLAGGFTVYGSLIRIPGGSLSDRFGGEYVAAGSFCVMVLGAGVLAVVVEPIAAFIGMMILGTGMGVANAAIFELVPVYIPEAVGGASGWIGGVGGAGTLIILPVLGGFVDLYGSIGYARGFVIFVGLAGVCGVVSVALKLLAPENR